MYVCDEEGEIYSTSTRKRLAKTFKDRKQGRARINLINDNGKRATKAVSRIVLSAKLGRELESWEDACHINGVPTDDRMSNLKASDRINNIIDELELGRLSSSVEYLELAICRLKQLLSTHLTIS